jgi:hypothetical protein
MLLVVAVGRRFALDEEKEAEISSELFKLPRILDDVLLIDAVRTVKW